MQDFAGNLALKSCQFPERDAHSGCQTERTSMEFSTKLIKAATWERFRHTDTPTSAHPLRPGWGGGIFAFIIDIIWKHDLIKVN